MYIFDVLICDIKNKASIYSIVWLVGRLPCVTRKGLVIAWSNVSI